jgi:hypothetical protein
MRFAATLQSLSLPALALAAALTLACADSAVTAPDSSSFAASRGGGIIRAPYVDDDGRFGCRTGYTLVFIGLNEPNPYDLNQNAYICQYTGNSKPLHMDDNGAGGCKRGYTAIQVSDGSFGNEYDLNGNDIICQLTQ